MDIAFNAFGLLGFIFGLAALHKVNRLEALLKQSGFTYTGAADDES